jgi:hypothetical protein
VAELAVVVPMINLPAVKLVHPEVLPWAIGLVFSKMPVPEVLNVTLV